MQKSRQNYRYRSLELQPQKRRSIKSKHQLQKSQFLVNFEGKINVITRQSGLIGVLMKSIKIKQKQNHRYDQQEQTAQNSRIKIEKLYTFNNLSQTIDNSLESHQNSSKENKDTENIINQKLGVTQKGKRKESIITPFRLPKIKPQIQQPLSNIAALPSRKIKRQNLRKQLNNIIKIQTTRLR